MSEMKFNRFNPTFIITEDVRLALLKALFFYGEPVMSFPLSSQRITQLGVDRHDGVFIVFRVQNVNN